jgi:hypothetical protein
MDVLYDYVSSDHKALLFTLSEVGVKNQLNIGIDDSIICARRDVVDWDKADVASINNYQITLDSLLSAVNIPAHALAGDALSFPMYKESIDSYYTAVIRCVTHACEESLPVRQVSCVSDFVVFE